MQTMNLKEARSHLSSLVDQAERGVPVIITRHGRKSAYLGPVPTGLKKLPSLSAFRAGITAPAEGLSVTVARTRREERY